MCIRNTYSDLFNEFDDIKNYTEREIPPGKSGAKVFFVSFQTKKTGTAPAELDTHNWVVKIVTPEKSKLLAKERNNIMKKVKQIYPDFSIFTSVNGAIATSFKSHDRTLQWYLQAQSTIDGDIIKNIFSIFDPWYSEVMQPNFTFLDKYPIDELKKPLLPETVESWNEIENYWRTDRYIKMTTCHGDLNLSNILINSAAKKAEVIDFSETGDHHWAYDFVRLEREITFSLIEYLLRIDKAKELKQRLQTESDENAFKYNFKMTKNIVRILNESFSFSENPRTEDKYIIHSLQLINWIRKECKNRFNKWFPENLSKPGRNYFEEEYLMMLAFQETCLLNSEFRDINNDFMIIYNYSIKGLLNNILHTATSKPYFYGYFYTEENGFERILVKIENNIWEFPIMGEVEENVPMLDSIHNRIVQFATDHVLSLTQYQFETPEIINQCLFLFPDYPKHEQQGGINYIKPILVKIKVGKEFDIGSFNFKWVKKNTLLKKDIIEDHVVKCGNDLLLKYIQANHITQELGYKILKCVDIIVFREKNNSTEGNKYEFLMLHRKETDDIKKGWEYPKGGLETHETINEGAIRELLEETGVNSIGDFKFGGLLGMQTPDVSIRGKDYNTLRVFGLTYYYAGDKRIIEDYINSGKSDEHGAIVVNGNKQSGVKWVSLKEATDQIWLKNDNYGPLFFQRWKEKKYEILNNISRPISLVYEITEKCSHTCKFCHRRKVEEEVLEELKIQEIIDILSYRGIFRLTISGGEPLLLGRNRLLNIFEYANRKQIHTCLSTTGLISDKKFLSKEDLVEFNKTLDHILMPLHTINETIALYLYKDKEDWKTTYDQVIRILDWGKELDMIYEVCTVVTSKNIEDVFEIGKKIFSTNDNAYWRIDEYYHNGEPNWDNSKEPLDQRDFFELTNDEFSQLKSRITSDVIFETYLNKQQIRFNSKESRVNAPDVMITPQGNIVCSSNNQYDSVGKMDALLHIDFKNRRSWTDYQRYCRSDWAWENYFS